MSNLGKKYQLHGLSRCRTYRIYAQMKARCANPNATSYPNYGAKGVRVCERWLNSFEDFLSDMGHVPSRQHSIDRIDIRKNYEPGNCRWATRYEQSRNTSRNRFVTAFGETKCVKDWANDPRCRCRHRGLQVRIDAGWDPEDAITREVVGRWAKHRPPDNDRRRESSSRAAG